MRVNTPKHFLPVLLVCAVAISSHAASSYSDYSSEEDKHVYYNGNRTGLHPLWRLGALSHISRLHFKVTSPETASVMEDYGSGLQLANGAELTRFLFRGHASVSAGIWQMKRSYVNSFRGRLEQSGEIGLVNLQYDLGYWSIPLSFSVHTVRNKAQVFLKFSRWINFLDTFNVASNQYGGADQADVFQYIASEPEFKTTTRLNSISAGVTGRLDPKGRFNLHVEPVFQFGFNSDKEAFTDVPVRQFNYGLNAGIKINYLSNDWQRYKQKRKQKLLEKQKELENNLDDIINSN